MSAPSKTASGRTIAIVLVTAAALVAAAMYLLRDREEEEARAAGEPLVASLASAAPALERIEIQSGDTSIVLARQGEEWLVASSGSYPADVAAVRSLVSGIAGLLRDEALTSRKERHGELGLAWPDESGRARLVRLVPAGGQAIEVVLGEVKFSPSTTQYARLLADDQTWRCKGSVTVETSAPRYMNAQILALDAAEVLGASYMGLDVRRKPPAEGQAQAVPQWEATLAPGPIDEGFWPEAAQTQAKSTLPTWLNRLELDDVRPRGESWTTDAAYALTFDTRRATVRVDGMREGDDVWIRLSAEPKADAASDASGDGGATAPDWSAWTAEVAPWEFKLPAWKKGALSRIREFATAPPPQPAPTAPPLPPPGG